MPTRLRSIPPAVLAVGGLLLVLVVAAAVMARGEQSGPGARGASNGTATLPAGGLPPAEPLRAFTATSIAGTKVGSAQLDGPTVVHIFASWCPTCRAEAKAFAGLLRANPSITPIYIAVADDPAKAEAFARASGWREGPIINDPKRALASKLGLAGQPDSIFVDAQGRTQTLRGGATLETLQRYADFATSAS